MAEESFGLKPEQLEPLHSRVILKVVKVEKVGRIVVPDMALENVGKGPRGSDRNAKKGSAWRGEVLAVGPDATSVSKGDVVLMPPARCLVDMGDGMFMVRDEDIAVRYHETGRN